MARVITQETYDEVVKENIEEFSMTAEEAIDDAIKQFEAQGIDLSNVIKDLVITTNSETIEACLNAVIECFKSSNKDDTEIVATLQNLETELKKDMARRILAAKLGAYSTLIDIIEESKDNDTILVPALKTITSLMTGYPDLLDDKGIALQIELLDCQRGILTVQVVLRWVRECCIRHELNRQNIFKANILDKLKQLLDKKETAGSELQDICAVFRALVLDDDIRHEYGRAHEHATAIARDSLAPLTALLQRFQNDKSVVGDLMLTLASLIVRNEFCQTVHDAGGLKFILDVMVDFPDAEKLNRQALKLLKALAGNDDIKAQIVTSGGVPLIVSAINRLKNFETIAAAGMGCISALTLRNPSNAGVFYDCGAPLVIVDTIKAHPNNSNVIRKAAWAVRNMSVRNKTESREFLEHGIEDLLQTVMRNHDHILAEDIKAALRDLGVNVPLKERWVGKGDSLKHDE
ncbi:armadillo repeat-containing protein 6 homolog [Neodiprion fabricii]|uniref:armadillo repeat-containing protein 6 homolog n=1 Tax=Neodiprion fabricii TaxID=2872261 RepID=UPI001ED934F1|nr:armadillo repeat-containing protein 6 homolog [Neodiprion fabricii]